MVTMVGKYKFNHLDPTCVMVTVVGQYMFHHLDPICIMVTVVGQYMTLNLKFVLISVTFSNSACIVQHFCLKAGVGKKGAEVLNSQTKVK